MEHLATLFGVGSFKYAPGTMGSIYAAAFAALILMLPQGWLLLVAATMLCCLMGTAAADAYMNHRGTTHDPKEIVIDEVAGQWTTYVVWYLWIVGVTSQEVNPAMLEIDANLLFLFFGFLLFRIFDILKPWPISWADRKIKGGLGVMLDDLLAGFAAGSVLYILYMFWPMVTGQMEEVP